MAAADSENTDIEFRAVMKFLTLKGQQPKEIFDSMREVYGDSSPAYSTVKKWTALFKQGRRSLSDDTRPGRPKDTTTNENIETIRAMVENDPKLKTREIALTSGLSKGSVQTILHLHLGMSKICARWIPRILTAQQKQFRADTSLELLHRYNADPLGFLMRVLTGDETWVHHYDPESKQESMEWRQTGSRPPLKARTQSSAGKIMLSLFWDAQGPILIEYLPHKQTITGQRYADQMERLHDAVRQKRRGFLERGVLLLHDNAPPHTSHVAQAAIRTARFEQLPHPPYSPDLAPSDFHLFPSLKKHLRGQRFANDEDLKAEVNQWLETQPKDFYQSGIEALRYRWNKCFVVNGDYIEKI